METDRIRVYPASREQMESSILAEKDDELKLALKWAFDHPGIIAVEAETDPDNVASQKVLKKCGFEPNGKIGEEGPRFTVYNKLSF